ncbi:hypothetical protein J5Y04_21715 [Kitasatospora sp. RG8]|uniref:LAETG motif-containing sortase-dependent surface protein n=1 Tax=Kitasatospora sp. RG8 TaxID=2820815 RepID=UPI001ADFBF35|nr:LAETG motif-containing sortase-dependent surface protein [Kitasatospora sp. RG8]MBP0452137.1 hypothetical protein [Kitasatospora sp. RG8]
MTLGSHVMRKSVMPSIAKNVRSISGRRSLATLAATVVLAGSVQLMTAESSWACGDGARTTAGAPAKPVTPASAHKGNLQASFHMTPDGQTITAGGGKIEIGVGITNFTGAPYENITPRFALYNEKGATRIEDFTVEAATPGGWKKLTMLHGCDPVIHADTSSLKAKRLDDGRAVNFGFRISVSANAAADLNELQIFVGGQPEGLPVADGDVHTFKVVHPASTKPTSKPTTTAKPTAKPTTTAKPSTKPAPAKPVEDKTPAPTTPAPTATATKAPAATPTATPSAPATTAPAGTPELAHTGSSSSNGFLAATAAALVALGAGALIAVRRLRPQR